MIRLERISKVFRAREVETTALNDINVRIAPGEFVAVMGPSGCGKSTLLNILGLLENPTAGAYYFQGENVAAYPERRLAQLRKSQIGFVFQSFNLIDELSVFANVELPLLYQGIAGPERRQRIDAALETVGISQRRDHWPRQLSGGQQQRVAVARAVVGRPGLILADEPTGNLDTANGQEIMDLLVRLNSAGTTIVMVTHSPGHAQYAQRIINMLDGHVLTENQLELPQEVTHA
jgi:putative ABC transport system ATP-binding protein